MCDVCGFVPIEASDLNEFLAACERHNEMHRAALELAEAEEQRQRGTMTFQEYMQRYVRRMSETYADEIDRLILGDDDAAPPSAPSASR